MKVTVVGECGEITETVRVGPVELRRARRWCDTDRLAEMFRAAGHDATGAHPLDGAAPEPDVWVLSDAPRAALVASGLHARVSEGVASQRARLLMLGGGLSFGGQQGLGGWQDDPILPAMSASADDTCERPGGVRLLTLGDTPAPAATFHGFNRLRAREGARVLATFETDPAAIRSPDGRVLLFTSDLLPHWGAEASAPEAVAAWLIGLLEPAP